MKIKKNISEIVNEWRKEVKLYNEPIAVHCHNRKIFILTFRPGIMIGYKGNMVNKYRKILRENGYFGRIEFVEMFTSNVKEF